jgi:DNA-binding transcriptional ArsR family regulator
VPKTCSEKKDESLLRRLYFEEEMSMKEIGDNLGVSRSAISSWMKDFGIETRNTSEARRLKAPKRLRDEEWVYKKYWEEGLTIGEISDLVDVYRDTASKWLERLGIEKRDYTVEFPSTDAENIEYWMGFFLGDGYIVEMENQGDQVGLALKDQEHVRKFKEFLGAEHSVTEKIINGSSYYRLHVYSNKLAQKLRSFGIKQNKSKTAKPCPKFKDSRHFWRGLMDADGTLGFQKDIPRFRLVGTEDVTRSLKDFLSPESSASVRKCSGRDLFVYGIHAKEAAKHMISLYSDCDVSLPRKRDIVLNKFASYLRSENISYE